MISSGQWSRQRPLSRVRSICIHRSYGIKYTRHVHESDNCHSYSVDVSINRAHSVPRLSRAFSPLACPRSLSFIVPRPSPWHTGSSSRSASLALLPGAIQISICFNRRLRSDDPERKIGLIFKPRTEQ